jgi:hypothetical protein
VLWGGVVSLFGGRVRPGGKGEGVREYEDCQGRAGKWCGKWR